MAATLKQIAQQAKLDISTVSRVLNRPDKARVSDETRQKIRDMADKLGYQVNSAGQSLARGRTGCVGILTPDLTDTVLAHYVDIVNRLLKDKGLQAIPFPTGLSAADELRALEALPRNQVDAIISLNYHEENAQEYLRLREQGYTIVFRAVDRDIDDLSVDCVGIDISDAYESLISHLTGRGYERIGIVGGVVADQLAKGNTDNLAVRYITQACRKLKDGESIVKRLGTIPCPDNTADAACIELLSALKKDPNKFNAFIVQSNKLLPGVLKALRIAGLSVPDQVGIATISDSELCRLLDVPVTVWDQPVEKICNRLVQIVQSKLSGKKELTKVQYASKLIERESSGGRVCHAAQSASNLTNKDDFNGGLR